MARKATVTAEMILETAFAMAREEGYEGVTARRIAAKAGCSTQPIFRLFAGMEELTEKVYAQAVEFFVAYYESFPRENREPFVNLGLCYIRFAEEEKQLFRLLFLSKVRGTRSMYELLNGSQGAVSGEVAKAQAAGCLNPGDLFMKMWIFIHGAACMNITGDFDLSYEETQALLLECYHAFSGAMG